VLLHDFGDNNTASTGCGQYLGPGIVGIEPMTPNSRLVVFADVDGVLGDLHSGACFADAAATLSRSGATMSPPCSAEIVQILHRTAERLAIGIIGFSDMSVEEVARDCHVPLLQARLAKLRQYGERFRVLDSNESTRSHLVRGLKTTRLRCVTGERYDYVGAPVNTSLGVNLLRGLYQYADENVLTVGIGGRMADNTLLRQVDRRGTMSRDHPVRGGGDAAGRAEAIVDIAGERLSDSPLSARGVQSRR
jgi:hypothetical protein